MSDEDRAIQAEARAFVDELIPHENYAEEHGGELPPDILEKAEAKVRELGWQAINMPKELGGGGFTSLQQVLVQEQVGRGTNAIAWMLHTPDDSGERRIACAAASIAASCSPAYRSTRESER